MASLTLRFDSLNSAAGCAGRAAGSLDDYVNALRRRVASPLERLPGPDDQGNAGAALDAVNAKIDRLNSGADRLRRFSGDLRAFVQTAQAADKAVADDIDGTTASYLPKRAWYQQIGDFLYDTFCVKIPNANAFTHLLASSVKWADARIDAVISDTADWFAHGDGRYIWKGIGQVLGTVATVALAVIAIASIPVTGGLSLVVVLAIIGAVAASVSATIALANLMPALTHDVEATILSRQHQPGKAYFVGGEDTVTKWVNRTDFGDAAQNNSGAIRFLQKLDTVKAVSDAVSAVVGGVTLLGGVKGVANVTEAGIGKEVLGEERAMDVGKVVDMNFSKMNVLNNLKTASGINFLYKSENEAALAAGTTPTAKLFDVGEMLEFSPSESKWNKSYVQQFLTRHLPDSGSVAGVTKFFKMAETAKSVYDGTENLYQLDTVVNGYDLHGKDAISLTGKVLDAHVKPVKALNKVIVKPVQTGDGLVRSIIGLVNPAY